MPEKNINPIKQEKDLLRAQYKARRAAVSPEDQKLRDAAICRAAAGLVSFRYAEYVLLYAPIEGEVDISALAQKALDTGKKIAFPRCCKEKHTMEYHVVSSMDDLRVDSYGIREPSPEAPVYDAKGSGACAVCFVPGLVYDGDGYRLGYGKGFYDRYLSAFSGSSVGVVYSDFVIPRVPRGRFDAKVDVLLTEKSVIVPKPAK